MSNMDIMKPKPRRKKGVMDEFMSGSGVEVAPLTTSLSYGERALEALDLEIVLLAGAVARIHAHLAPVFTPVPPDPPEESHTTQPIFEDFPPYYRAIMIKTKELQELYAQLIAIDLSIGV